MRRKVIVLLALVAMLVGLASKTMAATPVVPALQITYPNGGEVLHHNEQIHVTWNTTGFTEYGYLVILLESQTPLGPTFTIVRPCYPDVGDTTCTYVPNYGNPFLDNYKFRLPSSVAPGSYKMALGIVSFNTGEVIAVDRSDASFEVSSEPAVLAVISPATNVVWGAGTVQKATIFGRGLENEWLNLELVRVEGGETYTWGEWLFGTNFSGSASVIEPKFVVQVGVQPGTYALKAQSYDEAVQQSIAGFSPGIITVTSALKILNLKPGKPLIAGRAYPVRWNTAGMSKNARVQVNINGSNVPDPDKLTYMKTLRATKGRAVLRIPNGTATGTSRFRFDSPAPRTSFVSDRYEVLNPFLPENPPIGIGVKN